MGERERVVMEPDPTIQHCGWTGSGMQVEQSDQVRWVKMMNTTFRARSTVWMGEIQVKHRQFDERMGGVMELGQMQFDGRTREVMAGNVASWLRPTVWVKEI